MVESYAAKLAKSLLMEADACDEGGAIPGLELLGKKCRSAAEVITVLESRCLELDAALRDAIQTIEPLADGYYQPILDQVEKYKEILGSTLETFVNHSGSDIEGARQPHIDPVLNEPFCVECGCLLSVGHDPDCPQANRSVKP